MRTVGRSGFLQEPLRVRGCRSEYLTMSGFVDCRASLPFLISQSSCNYRFFSHSLCFFFLLIAIRYHRKQLRVISFSLSLPFLFLLFWRTDKCVCCGPRSARRPACSCCLGGRAGGHEWVQSGRPRKSPRARPPDAMPRAATFVLLSSLSDASSSCPFSSSPFSTVSSFSPFSTSSSFPDSSPP